MERPNSTPIHQMTISDTWVKMIMGQLFLITLSTQYEKSRASHAKLAFFQPLTSYLFSQIFPFESCIFAHLYLRYEFSF